MLQQLKISHIMLPLIFILALFCNSAYASNTAKIIFGTMHFYPPFVMMNSANQPYGFDIEIARAVCKELKATCVFKPMLFDDLFEKLEKNEIDAAISAITITPARKHFVSFTIAYFPSYASFIGHTTSNSSLKDIHKKIIGIQSGNEFYDYLNNRYKGVTIKRYDTLEALLEGLVQKKVDLAFLDTPASQYWVAQDTKELHFVGGAKFLGDGFGIAVHKDNTELLAQLNEAIIAIIRKGIYIEILKEQFGTIGFEQR